MPGANWTRKDYQAVAEMVGDMVRCDVPEHEAHDALVSLSNTAARHCMDNAALTPNGNRNFKRDVFIAECRKQAGLA